MSVNEVGEVLFRVVDVSTMTLTPKWDALFSDTSPLDDIIMDPIREIITSNVAWDSRNPCDDHRYDRLDIFRNAGDPVYGISGVFIELGNNRIHGRDERLPKLSFYEGLEFLRRLARSAAVLKDLPATPRTYRSIRWL
jgi:hypothetical protein